MTVPSTQDAGEAIGNEIDDQAKSLKTMEKVGVECGQVVLWIVNFALHLYMCCGCVDY